MDVFLDEFQQYVMWMVGETCGKIEKQDDWKSMTRAYDNSYDVFLNCLTDEQQELFNTFMAHCYTQNHIEMCIAYKIGMADKNDLKKYENLTLNKEGNK